MATIKASTNIDIEDHFSLENVVTCQKATTVVDRLHRWAQSKSLWAHYVGNSCCTRNYQKAIAGDNPLADSIRIMQAYSPMQADLLIVAGPISTKLMPEVIKIYEQMPAPKWVIAVGACTCSGGLFGGYNISTDFAAEIPVDVYVPGCPPAPHAIVDAFNLVREKIQKCGFKDRQ